MLPPLNLTLGENCVKKINECALILLINNLILIPRSFAPNATRTNYFNCFLIHSAYTHLL